MLDPERYNLNSTAVQVHLQIYQSIIARMANNSSAVKTWCVTVVSAMLVLLLERGKQDTLLASTVPVILFFVLDVYYLSLEKGFRSSYNEFVQALHCGNTCPSVNIFEVKMSSRRFSCIFKTATSFSVWPFYILILVIVYFLEFSDLL
ncbi:hypothetical protein SAMN04488490_0084 [Marinobacter sp. LV10R510-11A]|nr:hypothetical protein SAMN04488490_0084 [Marinobacter sp. LV10R510-11A]